MNYPKIGTVLKLKKLIDCWLVVFADGNGGSNIRYIYGEEIKRVLKKITPAQSQG